GAYGRQSHARLRGLVGPLEAPFDLLQTASNGATWDRPNAPPPLSSAEGAQRVDPSLLKLGMRRRCTAPAPLSGREWPNLLWCDVARALWREHIGRASETVVTECAHDEGRPAEGDGDAEEVTRRPIAGGQLLLLDK